MQNKYEKVAAAALLLWVGSVAFIAGYGTAALVAAMIAEPGSILGVAGWLTLIAGLIGWSPELRKRL